MYIILTVVCCEISTTRLHCNYLDTTVYTRRRKWRTSKIHIWHRTLLQIGDYFNWRTRFSTNVCSVYLPVDYEHENLYFLVRRTVLVQGLCNYRIGTHLFVVLFRCVLSQLKSVFSNETISMSMLYYCVVRNDVQKRDPLGVRVGRPSEGGFAK